MRLDERNWENWEGEGCMSGRKGGFATLKRKQTGKCVLLRSPYVLLCIIGNFKAWLEYLSG
jgi:hypothetical protein